MATAADVVQQSEPVAPNGEVSDIGTHSFRVTRFLDAAARKSRTDTMTLMQLREGIAWAAPTTTGGPPDGVKLAVYGDALDATGSPCWDGNVVAITGIEGPHTAGSITLKQATERLSAAGLRCLVVTAPDYAPGKKERWYILAPTSKELPPKRRAALVAHLDTLLGGDALAPESYELCRPVAIGQSTARHPHHVAKALDGAFIDALAPPAAAALNGAARQEMPTVAPKVNRAAEPQPNRADIGAHLAALFPPSLATTHPEGWIEIAWARPAQKAISHARRFALTEIEKAADFAAEANRRGLNVYVGPALRVGEAEKNNRASDAQFGASAFAWAEFDGAEDAERIGAILKARGLQPALVVTTGTVPHRREHIYVALAAPATDGEALKRANAALKTLLGSDAVENPSRLMRLGGTVNHPSPDKRDDRGYVTETTTLTRHSDAPALTLDALTTLAPASARAAVNALQGFAARRVGRSDTELAALLDASEGTRSWHVNVRDAIATMLGRGWSDSAIRFACRPYCTGGFTDADLEPLITGGREKWNKPNTEGPNAEGPKSRTQPKAAGITTIRASDVAIEAPDWLWHGHLLRGALALMTGTPNQGKSQAQISFVACVTTEKPWPDGSPSGKPASIIMLTAEDTLKNTIIPRLIAAGADLSRAHIVKCIHTEAKTNRQFLLKEDLEALKTLVTTIGDVALVTIDPITAYMGSIDSHKVTDVRDQLGPLKDFAEDMNVAVSAITHPPKAPSQKAIDHFIGSQAFIAACRIGHVCLPERGKDDEGNDVLTGRTLFVHVKHNLSTRKPTLAYRVASQIIEQGRTIVETSAVAWETDVEDFTGDQAVAAAAGSSAKTSRKAMQRDLQKLLLAFLKDGPKPVKEVQEFVKAQGYSPDQLRTARAELGIYPKKEREQDGPWMLSLRF